jgi:putative membrane protein
MNKVLLFLKGLLMGICDIIPGISGGTIAFITGIYERLIHAVNNFSFKLVRSIFKKNKSEFKKNVKKLDLAFLITLFLGIIIAILLGSRGIKYLLDNHFVYTISFFIGLILASSKIIFNNIKKHTVTNILFGVIGLTIGISLAFLIPATINPTLPYIFFGGFVAICAMFLPGISGAFILLIMGLYETIINALHDFNFTIILIFIIGAIVGALTISKVISHLFRNHKSKTLYLLLGLVIGAISVPVKNIYSITEVWSWNILLIILFILIGIGVVGLINSLKPKRKMPTLS